MTEKPRGVTRLVSPGRMNCEVGTWWVMPASFSACEAEAE